MPRPLKTITDVTARQLCTGCGACAFASPSRYEMTDDFALGRRPVPRAGSSPSEAADRDALAACPGPELRHDFDPADAALVPGMAEAWGPVRRVWEGYSTDETIRRLGSSGGAATALPLWALEKGGAHGVLHVAARRDVPYLNETVMSRTRDDLVRATGSRYAPASPCDGLQRIVDAPGPCVFVGKPCDVAAVHRARRLRPELDAKLSFTLAFFCAGTPSSRGTAELLRKVGVEDLAAVESLRYRGDGWPGRWTVTFTDRAGARRTESLSYEESWGFLQRYRQWRCYICPDHTGEFADVAVGDPWYRKVEPGETGKSLIVARTRRGEEVVLAAAAAGHIVLEREDPTLLPRSQPNLLAARGELWGRLLGLRLRGAPVPRYEGFATFRFWLSELGLGAKLRSVAGTMRRVGRKRLRREIDVVPWDGRSSPEGGDGRTGGPA